MARKHSIFLMSGLLAFAFQIGKAEAAFEPSGYESPVKVSVAEASPLSVKLPGIYEITNLSTKEKFYSIPNITLTTAGSGTTVTLTAGATSLSSASGFEVKETDNPSSKIARFTSDTPIRKGAEASYEVKKNATRIEAAEYVDSFTNSKGEVWYNVRTADGTTGWASSQTTLTEAAPTGTSILSVNSKTYRGSLALTSSGGKVKAANILGLENYIKGVVPNEMPAAWHPEALKAQAIVARSYAKNTLSLQNTAASQVYGGYGTEDSRTTKAVNETEGIVVWYGGKPVQTFFHSTSGGRTANVSDVWNSQQSSFPYLVTVEDKYENSPHSSWQYSFASGTILKQFGFSPSTVLYDIKAVPTGANGEVKTVTVETSDGPKTITGNDTVIRRLFPIDGFYGMLKSNWFTLNGVKSYQVQGTSGTSSQFAVKGQAVMMANGQTASISDSNVQIQTASGTITKESDPASIVVNGKGWGHRIGLSQYGAKGYAENGWKAEDIVRHYFPNTTVSK